MSFFLKLLGRGSAPFEAISIQAYREDYQDQPNHILLDVRTRGEFKNGHVAGASNMPLDQIEANLENIPHDKTVVVMCRTGNRSGMACRKLANAGYDNVVNLKGGIMAWQMAGHDVQN